MITIREWDWGTLLRQISLAREFPLQDAVRESIKEELEKLNFYGWNVICQVVENVITHGRQTLSDKLWLTVRDCVKERINTIRSGDKVIKTYQPVYTITGQGLTRLAKDIDDEIEMWTNIKPPLKYKGISVVLRAAAYTCESFDIEVWHKKGRPELSSILLDEYMCVYHNSITKEETDKIDGILLDELSRFLERLRALRIAQMKVRTNDYLEKRRAESAAGGTQATAQI